MQFNFDSGVKEYDLNGKCKVYFNPSDAAFTEKVSDALDRMQEASDKYGAVIQKETDLKKLFALARDLDGELREQINGIFGQDVCTPVFGNMNVTAAADGLPVWVNLMLAIIDEINTAYSEAEKTVNPKIQAYINKYKGK